MSVFETYLFIVDPFGGCDGHLNYRQALSVKKLTFYPLQSEIQMLHE